MSAAQWVESTGRVASIRRRGSLELSLRVLAQLTDTPRRSDTLVLCGPLHVSGDVDADFVTRGVVAPDAGD